MLEIKGKMNTAICYAKTVEDDAIEQIKRMCDYALAEGSRIRIMPDVHAGKGCTIGTTMTVHDKVCPNIVGVDIGCGMYTMKLLNRDIDFEKVDEAAHFIPSGMNVWEGRIERFDLNALKCYRSLKDSKRLERSLGTLGSGNHFIEIEVSKDGTYYFSKPVQADKLDELIIQLLPKELVHMQTTSETTNNPDIEPASSQSTDAEISIAVSEPTDIDSDLLTVDRALGLSYCMDSEELYNEVVSIYCSQATDYLPKLEQFFQNHDWENYTVIVHGLKSSSLNIGASNFSKLCLKHELAAKSKDEKFILVDYASYIVTLKALLEKLEGML